MRVWRGEEIDWGRIEEEHMPKKYCPGCYGFKPKQEYHLCEWNKDKERGNCKTCIARRTKDGAPYECNTCNEWFCKEAFEPHQRDYRSTHTRVCIGCQEKRTCIACGEQKYESFFTSGEWEHAKNAGRGKCRDCCERSPAGVWFCKGCNVKKSKIDFSQWILEHGQYQDKTSRCDTCKEKHEADEERIRKANKAMVIPSHIQPSLNAHTHTHTRATSTFLQAYGDYLLYWM